MSVLRGFTLLLDKSDDATVLGLSQRLCNGGKCPFALKEDPYSRDLTLLHLYDHVERADILPLWSAPRTKVHRYEDLFSEALGVGHVYPAAA